MAVDRKRAYAKLARVFGPGAVEPGWLWARWLFLRALGLIYASVFLSLAFQIRGLIGPSGILPADDLLKTVARAEPSVLRYWDVPTLLWLGASDRALALLVAIGLGAATALALNVAPRVAVVVCAVCFVSFVSAAQDFSSYQSDGMLLEASFASFFLAPRGAFPRMAPDQPPSWASVFLLRWEWFRIYFESGVVKIASGDPAWRDFTAMDHYYENGPLPTWIGWYAQQLPHGFHAFTAFMTLAIELVLVFVVVLGRRGRLAAFALVTPLQIGIILTANYAFLNYLVLCLGILLVDDRAFRKVARLRVPRVSPWDLRPVRPWRVASAAFAMTWVFYASIAGFLFTGAPPELRWLLAPTRALYALRIANRYGLFAVMTPHRYELELQGSTDGVTWVPYPFRFKPQDLDAAPGIYAPYQPRFEWNLWFASLSAWQEDPWVVSTEAALLRAQKPVLRLFARDPFARGAPRVVRTVAYEYHMTDPATKRRTGAWWRREELGLYCPPLERLDDGRVVEAASTP